MESKKRDYLDLRKIIGSLLTFYGVIIAGYGLFVKPDKAHLPFNINLWWGLVILIVGLAFLFASLRKLKVDDE
ncbi:hypothetical protein EV207_12442 [Scopulibacillus darangshiensis]|uniref:YrhC-like protein n=1 Tax=Scopulibacillus darangshiensis TaxID=442528 RepID=A0A4R2NRJ4_9BACL|nr:hypothetical protein [Scopulibacillus darangshiensis]TCP24543.1 hypothetical protein EV207_12442 [Scopulibacillus darangshiensis]